MDRVEFDWEYPETLDYDINCVDSLKKGATIFT